MTTQKEKADVFRNLHQKGSPVILFNIWDAGSARAIEQAGAKAIATGSWSVAAVSVPVTLDFEGGYAMEPSELKTNIEKVIATGAVGINFEDSVMDGRELHPVDLQCERIKAIREAADNAAIPFFINARTDVFLQTYPAKHDEAQLEHALQRALAYAAAGASGLFAPGLRDPDLIKVLCERSPLPVNIMMLPDAPPPATQAQLGVARISYGPGPYRQMIEALKQAAQKAFSEVS